MKARITAGALAAIALLAGCGGEDSAGGAGSTEARSEAATSTSSWTSEEDVPEIPTYADPVDMKEAAEEALPYLRCESDADTAEYDIHGGLGVTCLGRQDETISFDVFKSNDEMRGAMQAYTEINPSSVYHAGDTWLVGAKNERTLADLQRVLDPGNAPEVGPLNESEARSEYRRMVEPYNTVTEDYDYLNEYSEVGEYNELCTTLESAMTTFIDELEFAAWPDGADAKADKLATSAKSDLEHLQTCSEASTVDEANAALDQMSTDQTAANDFRSAIGLDNAATS